MLCPIRHILTLLGVLTITVHILLRENKAVMSFFSERLVHPLHRILTGFSAGFDFSAAELLIGAFVFALAGYLIVKLIRLGAAQNRKAELYRILITPICAAVCIYALFCVMWGTYYYGESFTEKSGISSEPVSAEQLEAVTAYFAGLANEYAMKVPRSSDGFCCTDRQAVLERSSQVYEKTEKLFPCLDGEKIRAKGIHHSKVMSGLNFTGFFFPFTGEANVNTDFPPALFAATAAHELAHQRGVAEEQECNFLAVVSSLEYGDADYVYSASLLAYIHLSNALYSANHDAWERIYLSLSDAVRLDLAADREYWEQFDTPMQEMSDKVYEGFLYSYDQELGLKSYGACVDLLVNYYTK